MGNIIKSYNPEGVDEELLTSTGKGGLLSKGYLRDDPVESYIGPDESPVFLVKAGKSGVSYENRQTGERERIEPGSGYRAFAVATDSRLLIIIGDNQTGRGDGDRSISIPYADIDLITWENSLRGGTLTITTAADVRWTIPCKERSLDDVGDYLETAVDAWTRLEGQLDEASEAVLEATQSLSDHEYDRAMDAIREAMKKTDAASRTHRGFCDSGVRSMADRIERVEDRIVDVRLRAHRARATHHIDEAEHHWRNERYDAAYDEYNAAHSEYAEALAVQNPDFDDSEPLRDKLARVERNLAYLEKAPLQRAEEARERADDTDDRERQIELLELALERYRTALELDWGRDLKRFEGDSEEIRTCIDAVASDLIDLRRKLAARRLRRGDRHLDGGRSQQAKQRYLDARELLEASLEPARELVPGETTELRNRLEAVDRRLADLDG